jgi:hypothetical protein
MRTGEAFPSQWLRADDLKSKRPVVVIANVQMEDIGEGERKKPVLYFQGKEKGLVLNRTNADAISLIVGTDEMDEWRGHQLQLYTTPVSFKGKTTLGIRVQTPPNTVPAPPPPQESYEDDEIPF